MTLEATYHCAYAWISEPSPSGDSDSDPRAGAEPQEVGPPRPADSARRPQLRSDVLLEVGPDGRFARVSAGVPFPPGAMRLRGVATAGFANAHSHAFHRALRGRTHDSGGSFWTWRERMYALAARLDSDSYLALATATYAEMALAGVTCVGEFHYLHHGPGGKPYRDPNAMGESLREAARRAGIRLTLLDVCYLQGGIGAPLSAVQERFSDGSADSWAARAYERRPDANTRLGVAIHSVRAVPPPGIEVVVTAANDGLVSTPLHVHVSEQPAENEACLAAYGRTPTRLLHDHGALTSRTTAVHATHLTTEDIGLLGSATVSACFCPTTERDLADGIGPARDLQRAGARLTLGTDQHAVVDLLEEARALEMHERLASGERGRLTTEALLVAMTADGHASLGWPEAGRLEVGAPADLVSVRLDTVRTAGTEPAQALLAATAADVDMVLVAGRVVVDRGVHVLGDVAGLLRAAIAPLWPTSAGGTS